MSSYNLSAGWGRAQTSGFPFRATGKIYLVADTTVANRALAAELFRGDSDGNTRIYTTLDAAVSVCTAEAGDVIYVAPGHAENITSATTLVLDIAGIKIIGLGEADNRPTFTYTTSTAATITVSADDITIENCIFDLTGVDAVAIGFTVSNDGLTLKGNKFITADSAGQATIVLQTAASTDDIFIEDNEFIGTSDAGTTTVLDLVSGARNTVRNNYFVGGYTAAVGAIRMGVATGGVTVSDLDISNNFIYNLTASSSVCISAVSTTMTGRIALNHLQIGLDSGACWLHAAGAASTLIFGNCGLFENYGVNAVGETGMLIGTVST